jgi:ribosomal protein L11 methyltransferase
VNWLEVSLTVSGELSEPVADLLARHAPGGVVLEGEAAETGQPAHVRPYIVRAYLPADDDLEARRRAVEEGLWHLSQIVPLPSATFRPVADEDWSEIWKEHYRPIPIGRRLLILPAWLEPPAGDRIPILLDPGMAFGTGTHPTTQLCLAALEDCLRPGDAVVDLGAGSGILSIAAARLGAARVLAVDIDIEAVVAAGENVKRNNVQSVVEIRQGSLATVSAEYPAGADILVANILASTLQEMAAGGLALAVRSGGIAILSGILADQAQGVLESCEAHGLRWKRSLEQEDWRALILERTTPPG